MTYRLKLFISGRAPSSQRAVQNLRKISEHEPHHQYEIAVVNVLEHPQEAEAEGILATPTLVRESPLPQRRILGDLSDTDGVLLGLDIRPKDAQSHQYAACGG